LSLKEGERERERERERDLPASLVYIPACNNLIEIMPVVVE